MPQPVAWGCTGLASVRTLDAGAVVRQEGRHSSPFQGNTRQSSTRQLGAAWAGHSRVATAAEGGVNLTGGGHRPGGSRLLPNLSATEALHWSGFFCDESFPASFLGRHEGDVAAPLLRGSVRRALPGSVLTTPPSITPHKSPVPPLAASASRHREFSLGRPQELTSLGRFANKGGRLKGVGSLGPKGSRAGGSGSQGPQSRKWPLGVPLGGQIKKRGTKRPYLLKPLGQLAKALTPQAGQTEVPGSDPFPAAPSPDRAAPAAAEAARSEAAASAGSAGLGTSAAAPPAPETAPKTVGEKGARKAAEEERREAGVEGEEVEEEREESPLAPVLREEQQLVSSWQAMLPDATPAARHSYYPRGFEDMDKGERLLTWRTGLILATVTLVLLFNAKWLAVEVATSALAIASAMLAVLLLPPMAFAALGLHLLSRLPEPVLDRVVDAAAVALTSAAAAYDLTLAALDLLPLQPVATGLTLSALVLTLHESLAQHPQRTDAPLWVSAVASLGYAVGLLTSVQLLACLAAATALAGALQLAYKSGLAASVAAKARDLLGRGAEQGTPTVPSSSEAGPSTQKVPQQGSGDTTMQQMVLEIAVPVAAALVAVADSLVIRLAVLGLYTAGAFLASSALGGRSTDNQQPASVIKAFLERIRWKALLQRSHVSPYSVVKFVGAFALLVAVRRSALVLYFRLNGA